MLTKPVFNFYKPGFQYLLNQFSMFTKPVSMFCNQFSMIIEPVFLVYKTNFQCLQNQFSMFTKLVFHVYKARFPCLQNQFSMFTNQFNVELFSAEDISVYMVDPRQQAPSIHHLRILHR